MSVVAIVDFGCWSNTGLPLLIVIVGFVYWFKFVANNVDRDMNVDEIFVVLILLMWLIIFNKFISLSNLISWLKRILGP